MGVYDTVMVPCPLCGTESGFQSKSGACSLATYSLAEAPDEVLLDVNRHAPNKCEKCGTLFSVDTRGLQCGASHRATVRAIAVGAEKSKTKEEYDAFFESLDYEEFNRYLDELARRVAKNASWAVDNVSAVAPSQVQELAYATLFLLKVLP